MKHALIGSLLGLWLSLVSTTAAALPTGQNESEAMARAMWTMMTWLAEQFDQDSPAERGGYPYGYPDPGPYLDPSRHPDYWRHGRPPLYTLNPASPWSYFGPSNPWEEPTSGYSGQTPAPPRPAVAGERQPPQPGQYPPKDYADSLHRPTQRSPQPAEPPSGYPPADYAPYAQPHERRRPEQWPGEPYWQDAPRDSRPPPSTRRQTGGREQALPRSNWQPREYHSRDAESAWRGNRSYTDSDGRYGDPPSAGEGSTLPAPQRHRWGGSVDLDGVWESPNGERWLVRGNRFWVQAGPDSYREGRFEIRDNSLFAEVPEAGASAIYEYMQMGDTLMLRDRDGNTLLFNRVER